MAKRRTKKQMAVDKLVESKAKLHTAIACKRLEILNKYDALDSDIKSNRRSFSSSTKSPKDDITKANRLKSVNIGRDLLQNSPVANTILEVLLNNVLGTVAGKLRVHTDSPDRNSEIEAYWSAWRKSADARGDKSLLELLESAFTGVFADGDCLLVFDLFGDGKLLEISADQLTEVKADQWSTQTAWIEGIPERQQDGQIKTRKQPLQQHQGVLHDRYGRVKGYVFTSKRGQQQSDLSDCTIVSADSAILLKHDTRSGTYRGISELLKSAPALLDLQQLQALELESAKLAASLSVVISHKDPTDNVESIYGDNLLDADADTNDIDSIIASLTNANGYGSKSTQDLDLDSIATTRDYLNEGDKAEVLDHDRPSVNIRDFSQWVTLQVGASHGLCKSLITGEVSSSYSGYRGEIVQSWRTITRWQKWIEKYLDWIAVKVIERAYKLKQITRPPSGWQGKLSWQYPTMPVADPVKESAYREKDLRNGLTTYQDILGPDWDSKLEQLSKELTRAKELHLPLAVLQTVSGQPVANKVEDIIRG